MAGALTPAGPNTPGGYFNANGQLVNADGSPYTQGGNSSTSTTTTTSTPTTGVTTGAGTTPSPTDSPLQTAFSSFFQTAKPGDSVNINGSPLTLMEDGTASYKDPLTGQTLIIHSDADAGAVASASPSLAAHWNAQFGASTVQKAVQSYQTNQTNQDPIARATKSWNTFFTDTGNIGKAVAFGNAGSTMTNNGDGTVTYKQANGTQTTINSTDDLGQIASQHPEIAQVWGQQFGVTPQQLTGTGQTQQPQWLTDALKNLSTLGQITPQQQALIQQAAASATTAATGEIQNQAGMALNQLRNYLTPGLGLSTTDTPILDRGDLIEQQALDQEGQATAQIQAGAAQGMVNYPLQQSAAFTSAVQPILNYATSQANTALQQETLTTNAALNRASLGLQGLSLVANNGLNLSTGAGTTSVLGQNIAGQYGSAGTSTSGSSANTSGTGGLLSGIGAILNVGG